MGNEAIRFAKGYKMNKQQCAGKLIKQGSGLHILALAIAALAVNPAAHAAEDAYLKQLEAELRQGGGEISKGDNTPSAAPDAPATAAEEPSTANIPASDMSSSDFEKELQSGYPSTYFLYIKLDDANKKKVYESYLKSGNYDDVTRQVLTLLYK